MTPRPRLASTLHRATPAMHVALLALCLPGCVLPRTGASMLTADDFAHLRFLEGRWQGTAPDGSAFYEQYSFPGPQAMRTSRYADAGFERVEDGSDVALRGGRVVSTWKSYTWEATELAPGRACFAPVNAPSAFCWERVSDTEARVVQRWVDEHGAPQQYVVPLRRL